MATSKQFINGGKHQSVDFLHSSGSTGQLASCTTYTITSKCPFEGYQIDPVPKGFETVGNVDKDAVAIACAACISEWGEVVFQEIHAISLDRKQLILTFYGENKKIPAQVISSIGNALAFLEAEVYVDSSITSKSQRNSYGELYSSPLVISIPRKQYHEEIYQQQQKQKQAQAQARKNIINISNQFSSSSSSSTQHKPILSNPQQSNNISLHQMVHARRDRSTISNVMGDAYDHDDNNRFNSKIPPTLSYRDRGIKKKNHTSAFRVNRVDIKDKRGFFRKLIDSALGVNYDQVVKQTINKESQHM
jgi:hypothetical protein